MDAWRSPTPITYFFKANAPRPGHFSCLCYNWFMATKAAAKSEVRVSTSDEAELAVKEYLATVGNPKPRGRQARPKPDFEAATKGITDPLAKLAAIKAERERVANIV